MLKLQVKGGVFPVLFVGLLMVYKVVYIIPLKYSLISC
jgi:hypothetical protein